MKTPFMSRLEQLNSTPTLKIPEVKAPPKAPMLSGLSTSSYDEDEMEYNSKKDQLTQKYESNKEKVAQVAEHLRKQVAAGQLSPADAEVRMESYVEDLTESEYTGYREENTRRKAAKYSAEHPNVSAKDAYNMYKQGYDPDVINRSMNFNNQMGILTSSTAQAPQSMPLDSSQAALMR